MGGVISQVLALLHSGNKTGTSPTGIPSKLYDAQTRSRVPARADSSLKMLPGSDPMESAHRYMGMVNAAPGTIPTEEGANGPV